MAGRWGLAILHLGLNLDSAVVVKMFIRLKLYHRFFWQMNWIFTIDPIELDLL
ncbi:hypothetical protein SAMN04488057_10614 [Cyclobacterium lianum]|uniref:Uncharacterized protein n=1 Tax=Cyclobacterium lianum TaxID=388280 RepID=A0A1M7NRI5_9BACT|nr:hypothetical protein SAMN04488057_10614 [Cyclobacterium lianum]